MPSISAKVRATWTNRGRRTAWIDMTWTFTGLSGRRGTVSPPRRIVRALARDRHVVHVAFAQAGAGDAHELRLLVQLGQRARADIAHGGAQTAGELVQHGRGRALVGHLAFDALRDKLERVLDVLLEVAVGGAARHGADRAH